MLDSPTGASSLGRTNGRVNLVGILLVAMRTAVVPVKPDRASGKVTAAPATAPILSTSRRFNDIRVSPPVIAFTTAGPSGARPFVFSGATGDPPVAPRCLRHRPDHRQHWRARARRLC